jgi:hypothetical protein
VYWSFIVCWAANAYGLVVTWFQDKQLLAQVQGGHPYVCDFVINYMAGQLSLACMHGHVNIYDPNLERGYVDAIIAPVKQEATFYAENPPSFFLFNTPLGLTDPHTAWICFCSLSIVLIVASLYLLSLTPKSTKLDWAGIVVATLCSFPAWICVRLGQFALVFFSAAICCFWSLERKKYVLAGLLAGILTTKLQYLPMIGLIGLSVGGYRYFFSSLLSVAIVVILSGLQLGWHNVIGYPKALAFADTSKEVVGAAPEQMQNLRGLLVQLTGTDSGAVHNLSWAIFIAAVIFVAFLWFRPYKRVQENPYAFRAYAALTIVIMLVFSPHTHVQDYILMTMPAVWLWQIPLPQADEKLALKKVLILLLCPLSWILFLFKLLPFVKIPPFALVGLFFGWYVAFKIIPSLQNATAEPDGSQSPAS